MIIINIIIAAEGLCEELTGAMLIQSEHSTQVTPLNLALPLLNCSG